MKGTSSAFAIGVLALLPLAPAKADVRLPALFSHHMVLAKAATVPVWGWADPAEDVTITLDGQTVKTTAGADGRWRAALNLETSGPGPFELIVQGKNRIGIDDVLVGEVWVASGQSNMEMGLRYTADGEKECARSANPNLRLFTVKKTASPVPQDDCEGQWVLSSPETTAEFSAAGYYFGKELQHALQAPVGIIHASWSGSPSEAWTSSGALDSDPDLKASRERIVSWIAAHPADQKAWATAFSAWLARTGREDRPTGDPARFAAPGVSTDDWRSVSIPGTLAGNGLPGTGSVWIRTEVTRDKDATGPVRFALGVVEGFESVYWDGELVTSLDYRDYPGSPHNRGGAGYLVPPEKGKAGKHTLAIRVFAPVAPAKFSQWIQVAGRPMTTGWVAKDEFALPPLSADELAAAPKPPAKPPLPHRTVSYLYNGMLHPIVPYGIRGVIWYQGEDNVSRARQYRAAFPLMIADWRKAWGGDVPFYFCQLANFRDKSASPGESEWAELREAQSMALALSNTGQAVLIDLGESGEVHARNKRAIGERLALIALARTYGRDIPFSGPVFDSLKIEGTSARLSFRHTNGGLIARPVPAAYDVNTKNGQTAPTVRNSPESELEGFAICGADRRWVCAEAKIEGDTVVVWSARVPAPTAVRYGWADNPTVNLYNGAGLPASPFRTDDFPGVTDWKKL